MISWRRRGILSAAVTAILFTITSIGLALISWSLSVNHDGGIPAVILTALVALSFIVLSVMLGMGIAKFAFTPFRSHANSDRLLILIFGLLMVVPFAPIVTLVANREVEAKRLAGLGFDLGNFASTPMASRDTSRSGAVILPAPLADWRRWYPAPRVSNPRWRPQVTIPVTFLYYDLQPRPPFTGNPNVYVGNNTYRIFIALLGENATAVQNTTALRYLSAYELRNIAKGYYHPGDVGWLDCANSTISLSAPTNTSLWATTLFSDVATNFSNIRLDYQVPLVFGDRPESTDASEKRAIRLERTRMALIVVVALIMILYGIVAVNPFVGRDLSPGELKRLTRMLCIMGLISFATTLNPLLVEIVAILCVARGMDSDSPLPWLMCDNAGATVLLVVGFVMLIPVAYVGMSLVRSAR